MGRKGNAKLQERMRNTFGDHIFGWRNHRVKQLEGCEIRDERLGMNGWSTAGDRDKVGAGDWGVGLGAGSWG